MCVTADFGWVQCRSSLLSRFDELWMVFVAGGLAKVLDSIYVYPPIGGSKSREALPIPPHSFLAVGPLLLITLCPSLSPVIFINQTRIPATSTESWLTQGNANQHRLDVRRLEGPRWRCRRVSVLLHPSSKQPQSRRMRTEAVSSVYSMKIGRDGTGSLHAFLRSLLHSLSCPLSHGIAIEAILSRQLGRH